MSDNYAEQPYERLVRTAHTVILDSANAFVIAQHRELTDDELEQLRENCDRWVLAAKQTLGEFNVPPEGPDG